MTVDQRILTVEMLLVYETIGAGIQVYNNIIEFEDIFDLKRKLKRAGNHSVSLWEEGGAFDDRPNLVLHDLPVEEFAPKHLNWLQDPKRTRARYLGCRVE